jgi:hypothetical protein
LVIARLYVLNVLQVRHASHLPTVVLSYNATVPWYDMWTEGPPLSEVALTDGRLQCDEAHACNKCVFVRASCFEGGDLVRSPDSKEHVVCEKFEMGKLYWACEKAGKQGTCDYHNQVLWP